MTDDVRKRVAMFIVLMILTLFCSTVRAAEKECVPGSDADDKPWTLTIPGYTIQLYGTICGSNGTPTEWEGRTKDKKQVFFSGTYILIGSKSGKSDNGKRIGW